MFMKVGQTYWYSHTWPTGWATAPALYGSTYLSPWSRILLENLIFSLLVKIFPTFYGLRVIHKILPLVTILS